MPDSAHKAMVQESFTRQAEVYAVTPTVADPARIARLVEANVSLCPDELFRKERQALRASGTPFAGFAARGQKDKEQGQNLKPLLVPKGTWVNQVTTWVAEVRVEKASSLSPKFEP
jgi:hypothetical protein